MKSTFRGEVAARTMDWKRDEHFWCGVDAMWGEGYAVYGGSVVRRFRRSSRIGVVELCSGEVGR